METLGMVRLKVADLLEERGWTAYRLAKEAGITLTVAYRLARPDGGFKRLDVETLDALCRVLKVQPGALLEYVADRRGRGR
jgi:DNA-binding Xre family transcriptional regulator